MVVVITSSNQIIGLKEKEIIFKPFVISKQKVLTFSGEIGDANDHNFKATKRFVAPAVQGSLSFALFGYFHGQVWQIPDTEPTLVSIGNSRFPRPVFVEQEVIPSLCITWYTEDPFKIGWRYEFKSLDGELLTHILLTYQY